MHDQATTGQAGEPARVLGRHPVAVLSASVLKAARTGCGESQEEFAVRAGVDLHVVRGAAVPGPGGEPEPSGGRPGGAVMGAVGAAGWPAQTPFVGRDEELSWLHDALRRAAAGRPGMVLVAGEAGVGKSRLAGRFAEQASGAGTVVAVGGAAPLTGGALPYAPLLQALRALADDHDPAAFGGRGAELAGVLAELAGDRPDSERGYGPEVGRGRLFERLRTLLGLLGESAALLLVLEDLHWADGATLEPA